MLAEIAAVFLRLGLTSFGGPVAHLGFFHRETVQRRHWLSDAEYADLVALAQFLPGPASSQVAFALGMRRGGILGALTASFFFTLPSALLMVAFAYGLSALPSTWTHGWLHGLKVAAVAVVAQAVWTMARRLCPDLPRGVIALVAAALVLLFPGAAVQVAVIAGGALAARFLLEADTKPAVGRFAAQGHAWAAAALVTFLALLVALPLLAAMNGSRTLAMADSFYRAGSLVFGGGHVVLPLLRAELVPHGWISDETFLAGYGFAQAIPGPLFTFAAFLGTQIHGAPQAWMGGVVALFAIFLPAWLLMGGMLPFWDLWRSRPGVQTAIRGANAAVVGILFAALCTPVCTQGITGPRDVAAALIGFVLLELFRAPAWLVVALLAAAGQWVL
jgi:chromate transporter